jgi:hypothetical protein
MDAVTGRLADAARILPPGEMKLPGAQRVSFGEDAK